MPDPFGIIGLLGVAAQFIQVSVQFGLDWKDAPDEVKVFAAELQTLKTVLSEVNTNLVLNKDFINAFEGHHSAVLSQLGDEAPATDTKLLITACRTELEGTLATLRERAEGHRIGWGRLKSAFLASKTREAVQNLSRQCQLLNRLVAIDAVTLGSVILKEIRDGRQEQKAQVETIRHKEILEWLTNADFATQQDDYIRRRQPGTGRWLLESSELMDWITNKRRTLLCQGIPGVGKTILTSIVVDELRTRFQYDDTVGIAYCYCNFQKHAEQKAQDLLLSILKQLSQGHSHLPDAIERLYERHGRSRRPPTNEISEALKQVSGFYSRTFVLVDALDECQIGNDGRHKVLDELFSLQTSNDINIFATSRLLPEITNRFTNGLSVEVKASNEDIQLYTDGNIVRLPSFVQLRQDLQEEIRKSITASADGIFLLAQLHLESLVGKRSPKALRNALARLPAGSGAYDLAYDNAMERIERQNPDQVQLAKQVLTWLIHAKEELTATMLQHALALEEGDTELDEENMPQIDDMVSVCLGLATIDRVGEVHGIIRLVHKTTEEYFQRTHDKWFPHAQDDITIACVTHLAIVGEHNRENSQDPVWDDFFRPKVQKTLLPYTSRNWVLHACCSTSRVDSIVDRLFEEHPDVIVRCLYHAFFQSNHAVAWWLLDRIRDVDARLGNMMPTMHYAVYKQWTDCVELLLERGAKWDVVFDGLTPLHFSVTAGKEKLAIAKVLVDGGVPVDIPVTRKFPDPDPPLGPGFTPLHYASMLGSRKMVKFLLEQGASPVALSPSGKTPLHLAVRRQVLGPFGERGSRDAWNDEFLLMENGFDVIGWDPNNAECQDTLARMEAKRSAVLDMLLCHPSTNCNIQDVDGDAPLHALPYKQYACSDVVEKLLKHGADALLKNSAGQTPFHLACQAGSLKEIHIFLSKGAKIGDCDEAGRNALHYAAPVGNLELLEFLISKAESTDLLAKDAMNRSVLHHLLRGGLEVTPESVQLFLSRGVGLNDLDNLGHTPLASGLWSGMSIVNIGPSLMKFLFRQGADPLVIDKGGLNLGHIAAQHPFSGLGHYQVLAAQGVDLLARDCRGRTVLHHLALRKNLFEGVCDFLCATIGLPVDSCDDLGNTPLDYAKEEDLKNPILDEKSKMQDSTVDILSRRMQKGASLQAIGPL